MSGRRRIGASEISLGFRDEIVSEKEADKESYEVFSLRKENVALKDQLNRALKEIKAYQAAFPSAYSQISKTADDDEQLPLFANSDAMTPLFKVYDARLKELEDIVTNQVGKLEAAHTQIEMLIGENSELRQLSLDQATTTVPGRDFSQGGSNVMFKELIDELNERINILMSENTLLVEQKSSLTEEVDNFSAELTRSSDELTATSTELALLRQEFNSLQNANLVLSDERDSAASKVLEYSDAVGAIESQLENIKAELMVWQNKTAQLDSQLRETKQNWKESVKKADADSLIMMRKTKAAETRVNDLHHQLLGKTTELDELQEAHRRLKKEYQSTRQDAESMLVVMSSLERQLQDFNNKENSMNNIVKESKSKVEESLLMKDQIMAREVQHRKEIDRLHEERKQLVVRHQEEIEQSIARVKSRHAATCASMEGEMKELAEKNADLRVNGEKAVREYRSMKESLDRWQRNYNDEKAAFELTLREINDKLNSVVQSKEEELRKKIIVQEQNAELRVTIDMLRGQIDSMKIQADTQKSSYDSDLQELRQLHRDVTKELAEKSRLVARKGKEVDDLKEEIETKCSRLYKDHEEALDVYRKRLSELEKAQQDKEFLISQEAMIQNTFVQDFKSRSALSISIMESKVKEVKSDNDELTRKLRSAENSLRILLDEKTESEYSSNELKREIRKLQEELLDAHSTINDLNVQIAEQCDARTTYYADKTVALAGIGATLMGVDVESEIEAIRASYPGDKM